MYCINLASPLIYNNEYIIGVRVYIEIFLDIIFSYSLTSIQTLTFGCIKWTPYVAFTDSFLDIVFGHYFRQEIKKLPSKTGNEYVVTSFCSEISPMVSCPFREEWEAGVWNQGIFRILFCILLTSYAEIILEATISRVFPTHM